MKRLYIILLMCIGTLLSSCEHPDLNPHTKAHPDGGSIAFFQFTDTTLMQKVMVQESYELMLKKESYSFDYDEPFYIPLYPKNLKGSPLFGADERGIHWYYQFEYISGDFYSVEDLVETPKFIALNDGYYICYPFTQLENHAYYVNINWKDLLTANIDEAEICTSTPYKKRYKISERELVKLTKKSTMHFRKFNKDMITIDDVVEVLNMLIETNTIEDHCIDAL